MLGDEVVKEPGMDTMLRTTPSGLTYATLAPQEGGPAPTLLLLAMAGADTLATDPYGRVGRRLQASGWNVVSLDLPCHGADRRAGEPPELAGWAARTRGGEDLVAAFRERVDDLIGHLVAERFADPDRIAAAGTSRGGFMAFHAAAGNPRIGAVAGFAPVTDLLALSEFAGQEDSVLVQRLALAKAAAVLADRAIWITIGSADLRVDTDQAIRLARALAGEAGRRRLPPRVTLHVVPTPGHTSLDGWHDEAARWFKEVTGPRGLGS